MIKEMEKALRLNERFGFACLNDPELGRLLRNLRELIRKTGSAMLRTGSYRHAPGARRAAKVVAVSGRWVKATDSWGFL